MVQHAALFSAIRWRTAWPLATLLLPVLAGCSPAVPDGQVLAQVAGTEITRRDLAAEPRPAAINTQTLLERVIDRKLLVQEAYAQNVDADPEYLAAFRRSREELLVAALRRKIIRTLRKPNEAELDKLASDRPWAFGARELISLTPVANQTTGLADKIIDTAQLDAELAQLVASDNEPIIIDGAAYRVVARNAAPLAPAAHQSQAKAIWLEEQINAEIGRLLNESRSSGDVKYSQGMGPGAE